MAERTRERRRSELYEDVLRRQARYKELAEQGRIVLKVKDMRVEQVEQSKARYYLHPFVTDVALQPLNLIPLRMMMNFLTDKAQCGTHVHQGGLGLFAVEGNGFTIVDGVKYDWKEGDMVLLPVKKGGVVHSHGNREVGKPCRWISLIPQLFWEMYGFIWQMKTYDKDWSGG